MHKIIAKLFLDNANSKKNVVPFNRNLNDYHLDSLKGKVVSRLVINQALNSKIKFNNDSALF